MSSQRLFTTENVGCLSPTYLCYSLQPESVNSWDSETDGIRNKAEKDGCSRWNRVQSMIFGVPRKIRKSELAVSLTRVRTEGNRIAQRLNCAVM